MDGPNASGQGLGTTGGDETLTTLTAASVSSSEVGYHTSEGISLKGFEGTGKAGAVAGTKEEKEKEKERARQEWLQRLTVERNKALSSIELQEQQQQQQQQRDDLKAMNRAGKQVKSPKSTAPGHSRKGSIGSARDSVKDNARESGKGGSEEEEADGDFDAYISPRKEKGSEKDKDNKGNKKRKQPPPSDSEDNDQKGEEDEEDEEEEEDRDDDDDDEEEEPRKIMKGADKSINDKHKEKGSDKEDAEDDGNDNDDNDEGQSLSSSRKQAVKKSSNVSHKAGGGVKRGVSTGSLATTGGVASEGGNDDGTQAGD